MATHCLAPAPEERDLPAEPATGLVRELLRAEGALVLALAILAYRHLGGSRTFFALLFSRPI